MPLVELMLRILHLAAAVAAAGGALFQYAAIRPALAGLEEAQAAELRRRISERWRPIVLASVAILLLTGLLNFLLFRVPEYRGTGVAPLYHGLFGLKLLAALLVFHPAVMLVLPGPKGDRYRDRGGFWLSYMLVLLILIIILGAILRLLPAMTDYT
jgi:uncharacterized membrane protein